MGRIAKDPMVPEADLQSITSLKALLKEKKALPTDLLQYKDIFRKYSNFSNYETKTLMHIAHFMSINPVTGLNTFNNILKITGK